VTEPTHASPARPDRARPLPVGLAMLVEFLTSACVLVLEIVAGRLLAPYVGVTLETTSAIIGTVLAGIALGTWLGGVLSDRFDPGTVLPVAIVLGGASSFLILPVVRGIAANTDRGPSSAVVLAGVGFLIPAVVLSAVGPLLIRQQLTSLHTAGTTVARISALGTVGAIGGSFITGFYLVAEFSTTAIVNGVGGFLVVMGILVALWGRRRPVRVLAVPLVLTGGAGFAGATSTSVCQRETPYVCASVIVDDARPNGRILVLDDLWHSYVDLRDPTHLEFEYIQALASTADSIGRPGAPLRALHIGGGGFTMPRYIEATRPGSTSVILERDPDLVDIGRTRLGFRPGPSMRVVVGDARVTLLDQPTASWDLVIGDAFGGEAAPWHLATREFLQDIRRALVPGGVYAMNIIDYPPLEFLRAELRTIRSVFGHAALISTRPALDGQTGANFVIVASDEPIDAAAIRTAQSGRSTPLQVLDGDAVLDRFQNGFPGRAVLLTDDYGPADQLFRTG
jgi:spermidine synthase